MSEETNKVEPVKFPEDQIIEFTYPNLNIISGRSKDDPEGDYHIIAYTSLRQRYAGKFWLKHMMFRVSLNKDHISDQALVYVAAQTVADSIYREQLFGKIDPTDVNTIVDPDQSTEEERMTRIFDEKMNKLKEAKEATKINQNEK